MKLGYSRLSSEAQTDGLSLEAQAEILGRAGCDRIYTDIESGWKGRSGESSDREQFQQMLADARQFRGDGWPVEIIFPEFSRWARNTITSMGLIEELEGIGITLRSMDIGPISVQTAGQWLNTMQQSMMAEFYSRQLSDKLQRTYKLKRSTGRPLQHKQPFGWRLSADKTKLEPNTAPFGQTGRSQWDLARELVQVYLGGASLTSLADHAAKLGIPLSGASAHRWLKNPIHQGHTWWYKQALPKGVYRNKGNNEREFIWNTHEPLITPAEWEVIEQRLAAGKRNWGINAGREINTLQGLCICADCGLKLKRSHSPTTANPDYSVMRCYNNQCQAKTYPHHKIEAKIIEAIISRSAELAEEAIRPVEPEKPAELIALESQRLEIAALMDRSSLPALQEALEQVDAQIAQFRQPKESESSREDYLEMAELISDPALYEDLSAFEKQLIFKSLIKHIIVKTSRPLASKGVQEVIFKF